MPAEQVVKMDLKVNISESRTDIREIEALEPRVREAVKSLRSGTLDYTGWVKLPAEYDRQELVDILVAAEEIKKKCSLLIVIGIGGSYLGACAAITALQESAMSEAACDLTGCRICDAENEKARGVRVMFAGNNISGTYHKRILRAMENEDVCLCVVSKSGSTTEIKVAFSVFKDALIRKYGEDEAMNRIYAVTDKEKGELRAEADREGYKTFIVPDNIGGRYSVLTPVGLLPIAAAGIDVKAMLDGAASLEADFARFADGEGSGICCEADCCDRSGSLYDYAAVRYLNMEKGTNLEIIEYYEPQLEDFAGWTRQLYGESEGKEGKGLYPASLAFSTDLHSMEQFLQEGSRIFFETVINVTEPDEDVVIPESAGEILAGRTMNEVNRIAHTGVTAAHRKAGIPMVMIDVPALSPYYFGQMIYFFEMTCAITGLLMGVDPFNQPGVENYKAEMRNVLNIGNKYNLQK